MTAIDTLISDLKAGKYSAVAQNVIVPIDDFVAALQFIASGLMPIGPEAANTFFAGPAAGAPALPTFRAFADADFAGTLNLNINTLALGGAALGTNQLAVTGLVTVNNPTLVGIAATDFAGVTFNTTFPAPQAWPAGGNSVGFYNQYTMTGDATNNVGDNLSFLTSINVNTTNTLPEAKGMQSSVYVGGVAASILTEGRAFFAHMQVNNALATVTELIGYSSILPTNNGAITTFIDFLADDFSATPGITTKYAFLNRDAGKIIQSNGPTTLTGGVTVNTTALVIGAANQISLANGSAAAPTIAFTADLTTGIYGGAGAINFAIGGARDFGITGTQFFADNANGPRINNTAAGAAPQFSPNRSAQDAGIGADAAGDVSIYVQKAGPLVFEALRCDVNGNTTAFGVLTLTNGVVGTPAIVFANDATSGLYSSGAATINVAINGARTFGFNANSLFSNNANGGELVTAAASATQPTFIPNRSDAKAGVGANAAGAVSLISDIATVATEGVRLDTAGDTTIFGNLKLSKATLLQTTVALTNNAGAQVATMTNGPTAGNPTKWIPINDNGTVRNIPAW